MEFGSHKSWTYVFSPLHKWQNLKAITSLVKAFFSLSCSSDCTDQSLLPPPASRSSWLCHSCTCPGKSPSIPMRVSQPCCHGKKDRLNRGWSQTTTAQTLPGRAVLSAVAQGGRKHGLSHAPNPPKNATFLWWATDLWKAAAAHGWSQVHCARAVLCVGTISYLKAIQRTAMRTGCFRRLFETFDFAPVLQKLIIPCALLGKNI